MLFNFFFRNLLTIVAKTSLLCALLFLLSCNKNDLPRILNRTCLTTQHHDLIIGNIDVYIKYNATDFNFPGWEDLLEYDTSFTTNSEGFGCIENLPIGKHWVAGLGFDETIKRAIKGRIFIDVTFENPEVNEILYVGEE